MEQIVDIPDRGGLQGILPGQGSSSSCRLHDGTDDGIHGFFSHFSPGEKSAEVLRQSSARVPASPSSSELASHQMAPARESDESGEDGTGDSLSAAYAALRRLRRREGVGERAEAWAVVQLCRSPWVSRLWTSL